MGMISLLTAMITFSFLFVVFIVGVVVEIIGLTLLAIYFIGKKKSGVILIISVIAMGAGLAIMGALVLVYCAAMLLTAIL